MAPPHPTSAPTMRSRPKRGRSARPLPLERPNHPDPSSSCTATVRTLRVWATPDLPRTRSSSTDLAGGNHFLHCLCRLRAVEADTSCSQAGGVAGFPQRHRAGNMTCERTSLFRTKRVISLWIRRGARVHQIYQRQFVLVERACFPSSGSPEHSSSSTPATKSSGSRVIFHYGGNSTQVFRTPNLPRARPSSTDLPGKNQFLHFYFVSSIPLVSPHPVAAQIRICRDAFLEPC